MDIVEYLETVMNTELSDWQKERIRTLYELSQNGDVRLVFTKSAGRSEFYVYINEFKRRFLCQ